ncbi:hypothetical protein M0C34_21005 [Agarivorans sp. TSD2052]|uniref:c-type cytochrome n=1 Tax=Agarivorans sp. TSD2052 TaxID=2937286 RepID=UPI00200C49F4|nr:hypothetical protein [Agarivorans sp. TSD2052]UPW18661.1 hypothetical protein M0C34_21005 [Agarivorans sp. TSD2052]
MYRLFSYTLLSICLSLPTKSWADQVLYRNAGGYGCSACHGKYANGAGNVGGNIRGASLAQLNSALNNEPSMLLLASVLTKQQRRSLSAYLESLGKMHLVEWTISDSFAHSNLNIHIGEPSQLVVKNDTFSSISIDLSPLGAATTLQVAPLDTEAFTFTPASESSTTTLATANQKNTLNLIKQEEAQ